MNILGIERSFLNLIRTSMKNFTVDILMVKGIECFLLDIGNGGSMCAFITKSSVYSLVPAASSQNDKVGGLL